MRRICACVAAAVLWLSLCGCDGGWLFKDKPQPVSTTAVTAPQVTVTVESGCVNVGDTVILPVTVNADAHLVNADIFLRYDPALLEPVLQYDAETDSERYVEPGIFSGTVHSELLGAGTLYVLLAAPDNGTADKGTLFYAAFRLLADPGDGATVMPDVSVCRARADGRDVDPIEAGTLTLNAGVITAEKATATETIAAD